MTHTFINKILLLVFATSLTLAGCKQPLEYKKESDEKAYKIIDSKWRDEFGEKVNYKISDTNSSPNAIQIEKVIPESGVITLPQAVALATSHNRQYQLEKEALYIMALDLTLVRHQFEPSFFGRASSKYEKETNRESLDTEAEFGFDQLLADGARISTNVTAGWLDIMTGDFRSGLTTILSATVTKPLLRGSDRKIVLENLTQAERNALYQLRLFGRFRQTFVVEIAAKYYHVLQLNSEVENAKDNCDTLIVVYEKAEKLAIAGRLPLFELDQAKQDKLQAKDILITAQKNYKQALDEFKLDLALPSNAEFNLDYTELEALKIEPIDENKFSGPEIIRTALNRRLDLANSIDEVEDADRKVKVAADQLRAELNVVAGIKGQRDRSTSVAPLNDLKSEVDIGLEADLPFDRTVEQNIYRKSLITLSQRRREKQQATDQVIFEVRQAWREMKEASQRYKVNKEALELANKRFDNTLLLLQYGRSNTRDVLDAQEDLFDAKNAATNALVNYTIATLSFYRDSGVLQVRPDGMWKN